MSWKDSSKEWGPEFLTFLSAKGSQVSGMIVGDPVTLKGVFNKQENRRIGCPMITDDGYTLVIIGMRVAHKLVTLESKFGTHVITITRESPENDPSGKYSVVESDDKDRVVKLKALAKKIFTKELYEASIAEAQQVVGK